MISERMGIMKQSNKMNDSFINDMDNIGQVFSKNNDWETRHSSIEFEMGVGSFTSTGFRNSEAWYLYDKTFKSTKDFTLSATVGVPKEWDTFDRNDAQVGIGLFVGKKGDHGHLVYECNLATVSKEIRFVQGQIIKNRRGEDPVAVDDIKVDSESGVLKIQYFSNQKKLALYFDEEEVGSEVIDKTGNVDWNMSETDEFIVGFMGFSELTDCQMAPPVISNIKLIQE